MLAYGYTQTILSNLTEISKTGNHFYNFKGVNFLCKLNPKNTNFEAIFFKHFSAIPILNFRIHRNPLHSINVFSLSTIFC